MGEEEKGLGVEEYNAAGEIMNQTAIQCMAAFAQPVFIGETTPAIAARFAYDMAVALSMEYLNRVENKEI